MNGITSMQRSSTSYADYGKFASGKKVNRAADGAAELAIIQKQETQTRSYKVGENNIGAAKDMLNVADGAMSGITDYLQKIRELGVRASNTVTITDAETQSETRVEESISRAFQILQNRQALTRSRFWMARRRSTIS